MIAVGSRPAPRTRLVAAAAAALTLGGILLAPATANAGELFALPATVEVSREGTATVSTIAWELPAGAGPGDTVRLDLPGHAGGATTGADWIAASGAVIGTVRYDPTGALVVELGAGAAESANRHGSARVHSDLRDSGPTTLDERSDADSTLRPGGPPTATGDVVDRTRGTKFGVWTDATETVARWTLEAPRGPWDVLEITDVLTPGHRVDCAAGVTVRATSTIEPSTGHLLDLVEVEPDRVVVTCDAASVRVAVSPVGDEVVEVSLLTVADAPSLALSNTASFVGSLTRPGTLTPEVDIEQFVESPPTEPTPTPEPPREPTPEPTPPSTPEPTPSSSVPPRLARTGGDAPGTTATIGAVLLVTGTAAVAAAIVRRRRTT